MVHGFFRASGIVMIYRLHHEFGRQQTGGSVQNAWVISGKQRWVILGERRSKVGQTVSSALLEQRTQAEETGLFFQAQFAGKEPPRLSREERDPASELFEIVNIKNRRHCPTD
jgi:hypothetical protein